MKARPLFGRSLLFEVFVKREFTVYEKYEKHFPKMLRDVGMAVPKTTETRCRGGQCTGKTGYKKTTQATPSLHLFFLLEIVL